MQQTRRLILDYLKAHGQATVDELAEVLSLTPVTVRHHLDILRSDELIAAPAIRHRTTPGRPQHVYSLTDKASQLFPNNYGELATQLISELKQLAAQDRLPLIFDGLGARLAAEAPEPAPDEPLAGRLQRAVDFLNRRGYVADWGSTPEGFLLRTCHCPYEFLAPSNPELCRMDAAMISRLVGVTPTCLSRVADGAGSCAFLIRRPAADPG